MGQQPPGRIRRSPHARGRAIHCIQNLYRWIMNRWTRGSHSDSCRGRRLGPEGAHDPSRCPLGRPHAPCQPAQAAHSRPRHRSAARPCPCSWRWWLLVPASPRSRSRARWRLALPTLVGAAGPGRRAGRRGRRRRETRAGAAGSLTSMRCPRGALPQRSAPPPVSPPSPPMLSPPPPPSLPPPLPPSL